MPEAERTMLEAINLALRRAMGDDDRVVVFGEDVGLVGGVFRATDGLLQAFGPKRVLDTPLAETLIAGLAIGLAAQGFRPVAEIQFMVYIVSDVQFIDSILSFVNLSCYRLSGQKPHLMLLLFW